MQAGENFSWRGAGGGLADCQRSIGKRPAPCFLVLYTHRVIWPAIESIVRARPCWGSPAVIEGWAILPGLFFGADLSHVDACWLLADEPTPNATGFAWIKTSTAARPT